MKNFTLFDKDPLRNQHEIVSEQISHIKSCLSDIEKILKKPSGEEHPSTHAFKLTKQLKAANSWKDHQEIMEAAFKQSELLFTVKALKQACVYLEKKVLKYSVVSNISNKYPIASSLTRYIGKMFFHTNSDKPADMLTLVEQQKKLSERAASLNKWLKEIKDRLGLSQHVQYAWKHPTSPL